MSFLEESESVRYPWYMRILFSIQRRRYGHALAPVRLWGRIPRAYPCMAALYRAVANKASRIEPPLRSLIQVLVSRINWCDFCIDLNTHLTLGHGTAPEKIQALSDFERSPLFTEREKAALRYAAQVTRSERRIESATLERLREHFDDQAIVELAALIAYQNMSSKFNFALGIPAHGFCELPKGDPKR